MARWRRSSILATALVLLAVMPFFPSSRASPSDPASRVRERAGRRFQLARLYRPALDFSVDLDVNLAPLLLFEVLVPDGSDSGLHPFGASLGAEGGPRFVDRRRPTVYVTQERAAHHDHWHTRRAFVWWTAISDPDRSQESIRISGVRITDDTEGRPAIYEIRGNSHPTAVLAVSASLEQAAESEHGPPLPGRRFAVERSRTDRPEVVVARVLAEAPIPLGPFAYVEGEGGEVSTLLCRCMPSQTDQVLDSQEYEILPLEEEVDWPVERLPEMVESPGGRAASDGEIAGPTLHGAERSLRLPRSF